MRSRIAVMAGVLALAWVNFSIVGKERHLATGRIVYLELAPVDPRSLMQGDYMALRFKLAAEVRAKLPQIEQVSGWQRKVLATDGRVVVALDEKSVGQFARLEDDRPLARNEVYLRYRVRNGDLKFATNAFFFQEGHAQIYQQARYGQFRVDDDGELLLTHMYDKDLNILDADNPAP